MNIIIDDKKGIKDFQSGDTVSIKGFGTYLIIYEYPKGYILKDLSDGRGGFNGHHESLEELQNSSIKEYDYAHYSQDDYNLVLVKK